MILNQCDYFSRGLNAIISELGEKQSNIHLLDNLYQLEGLMRFGAAQVTFISEWNHTSEGEREEIKNLVATHSATLFIIFVKVPHSAFEEYIYIKPNVIVMADNVSLNTVKSLIAAYRAKSNPPKRNDYPLIDRTVLSFSKRESEILQLWMKERTSEEISQQANIKIKTVLTHKNNLKKKSKSKRTNVLFQIVNIASQLTSRPQHV